jgi:hypothetical protein
MADIAPQQVGSTCLIAAVRGEYLLLDNGERNFAVPLQDARELADWIMCAIDPPTSAAINRQQIERFRVALAERGLK